MQKLNAKLTPLIDGTTLAGGNQYGDNRVHKDANGHLYVRAGNNLIVDGNLLIQNYGAAGDGRMRWRGGIANDYAWRVAA